MKKFYMFSVLLVLLGHPPLFQPHVTTTTAYEFDSTTDLWAKILLALMNHLNP
jgi:hypothetical protein